MPVGPSVSRLNNAGQPSLTQPGLNLLQSIFGGSGQNANNPDYQNALGLANSGNPIFQKLGQQLLAHVPQGSGAPAGGGSLYQNMLNVFGQSALQRQLGNSFGQLLGPNAAQAAGAAGAVAQAFNPTAAASSALNAYQPIFQRNLNLAQDQGPRFSSGNDLLRTQALNDYNLFASNVLQNAQNRAVQAGLGALGGASQFGSEQAAQQQGLMQQLLNTLFTGGGVNAGPIYNVQPGIGQQLFGLAGQAAGALLGNPGMFGGGGGGGNGIDWSQVP